MRKITNIFLVILLCLGCVTVNVFADDEVNVDNTDESSVLKQSANEEQKVSVSEDQKAASSEKVSAEKEQKAVSSTRLSALLENYNYLKKKHPDAVLLFRVGDFYETYKEDAE